MNATELYTKSGKSTGVFYCTKCRVTHRTEELAERCCKPYICKSGAEAEKHRTVCETCRINKYNDKLRVRFEKAEKLPVSEATHMVFSDHYGDNEGFANSVEEMLEWFDEEKEKPPTYIWACKSRSIVTATSEQLIESCFDGSYEDWEHDGEGIKELDEALAEFVKMNDKPQNKMWEPDYTRAIILKEVS